MRVIHRPLPSELDEAKVLTFMDEMRVSRQAKKCSRRPKGGVAWSIIVFGAVVLTVG